MKNKMLTRATILLLASFLLPVPVMSARAMPSSALSLSPASPSVELGNSFSAQVQVAGGDPLVAYDISVLFNPAVFTVTGASLSGTLFDPAGPNSVFVLRQDIFNPIGVVRYAVVVVGGADVTPSSSGSALLNIVFQANNPGSTASDYPSAISFGNVELVGVDGGQITDLPFSTASASYLPPANTSVQNVGCRAANDGFNTASKGLTDPVFCRVANTGSSTITVSAVFSYRSVGGVVGSVSGGTLTLAAGQSGQVNGAITVPNANDIFIVTGTTVRLITMSDSTVLAIPGASSTFKIVVNAP